MRIKNFARVHNKLLILGGILLVAGSAMGFYGGGIQYQSANDGYLGSSSVLGPWFEDEPCFTVKPIQRNDYPEIDAAEFVIDVTAVEEDQNPATFARCRQVTREQMTCEVGTASGTVAACVDSTAPSELPQPGDVLRLVFDLVDPGYCDVVIERSYDVIDPKCRVAGSGGSTGSGGSGGGSGTCNSSTAQATLTTGQTTTIASNACVRLKNETAWSSVDPKLVAMPGTVAYPVPFNYTWCSGTSNGTLTGNYQNTYLINGQGSTANYSCDIYVKLGGTGSQVQFQYFQ